MAIITSTINAHVYIAIANNIHIPTKENWVDNKEDLLRPAKRIKAFLKGMHIESMALPALSTDLKPIEDLCWKIFQMAHEKDQPTKENLLTAIGEC